MGETIGLIGARSSPTVFYRFGSPSSSSSKGSRSETWFSTLCLSLLRIAEISTLTALGEVGDEVAGTELIALAALDEGR